MGESGGSQLSGEEKSGAKNTWNAGQRHEDPREKLCSASSLEGQHRIASVPRLASTALRARVTVRNVATKQTGLGKERVYPQGENDNME